ncbi:MAG: hypothetical protein ABIY50_03280 [Ignavibacteria bacterium]
MNNKSSAQNISLRLLSPEEFVKLYDKDKESIIQSSIILPELGKPGYGKIIVECHGDTDLSLQYLKNARRES